MLQQVRETELSQEKAVLVGQLDELRAEVAKLNSEKQFLHQVSCSS